MNQTDQTQPCRSRVWGRGGPVRFVAVFVACMLVLLTGYRYSIDTPVNDWYLFQVAKHTTRTLDLVGHRAVLEDERGTRQPAAVRAKLREWSGAADADAAPSEAPLTAWDRYRFRIETSRRNNFQGAIGPRVSFVLTPGLQMKIQALEKQAAELRAGGGAPAALDKVNAALKDLREQQAALPPGPEGRRALIGKRFTFIVVPECGAIEVMAIFLAAVVAFPTTRRKQLLGILLGLPIMYGINVLRLSCLEVIGALVVGVEWLYFAHEYVWQSIYVVFVVAVWLAWVEYIVKRRRAWKAPHAAAA